mgnify:CR=1 FL=1
MRQEQILSHRSGGAARSKPSTEAEGRNEYCHTGWVERAAPNY